jgi:porin
MKAFRFLVLTTVLLAGVSEDLLGQSEDSGGQPQDPVSVEDTPADCSRLDSDEQMDAQERKDLSARCRPERGMSSYLESVIPTPGETQSVEADLADSDKVKPAIFPIDVVHNRLDGFYWLKERVNDVFGLAFSIDYTLLAQRVSHSDSDTNTGSSSVFRILGTWLRVGDPKGTSGHLVWKTETRNPIWGNPTPRDLGFTTGSALSTANFKSLDWGITDLYWRQKFNGGRHALQVGHMDPGDWADQYPLLNAWTAFMSDAFYNNPTEAIPKRGFGITGQAFYTESLYVAGGVHDANGGDGDLDFDSFWNTREWFSWIELGRRGSTSVSARHNTHIHYWHQDRREEADTEESRGLAFTYSYVTDEGGVAFVRAGYSRGDAPQMRRFIGIGGSYQPNGRDTLGIATSWGSPPEKELRNQVTSEIFYRLQVTQNLTLTPNLQLTFKPSYTLETRWVAAPGIRMRFVF